MLSQQDFFAKYDIDEGEYRRTGLEWSKLSDISVEYERIKEGLLVVAQNVAGILQANKYVHSVRWRVKNTEHLIEKVIRKKIEKPERNIDVGNFLSEIQDVIGVRALHLYKKDWLKIHEFVVETFELEGSPVANHRDGDDNIEFYTENSCVANKHKRGYRSVHYIIKTAVTKIKHSVELQVRTIFEEGWSEIDHDICYPYSIDDTVLVGYLAMFNRLAGAADEMGGFAKTLKEAMIEKEGTLLQAKEEHEKESKQFKETIRDLEGLVNKLKINKVEKDELISRVVKISAPSNSIFFSKLLSEENEIKKRVAKHITLTLGKSLK